jgi:hypothetical protein
MIEIGGILTQDPAQLALIEDEHLGRSDNDRR